ncbi:MAG: hypothetical protein D6805_02275 [Planctomycetota bacterium]|nr:MAG: hypothetical protein D6805_02275 [Planctomycetota bacterium]
MELFAPPPILRSFLCALVQGIWGHRLDFSQAQRIDKTYVLPDYRKSESDILYQIPYQNRDAFVYILLEHQSTVDFLMPFRVLFYIVQIWWDYVKQDLDRAKQQDFRLPPIFPVVLYTGPGGWSGEREFVELVEGGQEFLPRLPNFRLEVLEVSRLGEAELGEFGSVLGAIFLLEQGFHSVQEGEARFYKAREHLGEVGELLGAILR